MWKKHPTPRRGIGKGQAGPLLTRPQERCPTRMSGRQLLLNCAVKRLGAAGWKEAETRKQQDWRSTGGRKLKGKELVLHGYRKKKGSKEGKGEGPARMLILHIGAPSRAERPPFAQVWQEKAAFGFLPLAVLLQVPQLTNLSGNL